MKSLIPWRCCSLLILWLAASTVAAAQEALALSELPASQPRPTTHAASSPRPTTHATLVGVGAVSQLDTYLSPLDYHGPQLHLLHEMTRGTRLGGGAVSFQGIWQANVSYTKNRPAKARTLGGDLSYDFAWHYNWSLGSPAQRNSTSVGQSTSRLTFLLGPRLGANVGFLYNTRNGNNPAQALASLQLSASAAALCHFRLWGQPLTARYQLDVPLIGIKFSPNYGQSYYEIFSEGNGDHNVCVTYPGNAFSSRHMLTLDLPFRRNTLRVGYLADIRQSHVNSLKYHSYSHAFLIGWVRHLQNIPPRR